MSPDSTDGDARRGRDAADWQIAAQARRREQEAARAQPLIDRFVADAKAAGIAPVELTARPWSGGGRYRTGIQGWYLKRDRSIGIGEDGGYYLLVVAPTRFGRFRRVDVSPTDPPLQVGEGARDGETGPLAEYLALRLAAGPDFP
ncbi:hypothetical protein [Knoellia koreensis]|uniref:Uncharacterized protein n=1 Tax=Knoellia koreensis TaxID=2730921 RepID=A0A849HH96_9MICO|nr:hypothetical protein [Knoellia sp. DB2414S]NNM46579.1 hypothetical protein [Knoellia sp. DB2414S]